MSQDELEIRQLVATWIGATKKGDLHTVLSLMTEDIVFLMPGRPPLIGRAAFEAASSSHSAAAPALVDGESEIQEIVVSGDWAHMWTKLKVTLSSPGAPPIVRAGHTLSVLRKQEGRWLLARDANMLSPVDPGE